jgi:type IV pilus assembly protein PilN
MKIRLNLATKALQTHRRFLAGAGLTAVFAGLAFLGLGWHVYSARKVDAELRSHTQETRQEMARLEAQRKELEHYFSRKDIAELHDRAAFINSILDARGFNWTLMFMDLERLLPGGVRVISIEPKQVAGHVELKLTVGATSDEAKLKFLKAIEESNQFSEVQVQSVQSSNATGNQSGDQRIVRLTTFYSRT